ncbi:MAG: N-acetyltransferase [Anaerolineales bacterium]|nr:N-acetyltransferase [Anaerolineales bacterium]
MINVSAQPRRVELGDHYQISNLIFHEANIHRHLDWRSPLEWIGAPNYWALEEYGHITAALACPEDPPRAAWIRLFGHQPHLSPREAWTTIWGMAHETIRAADPQTRVASIVTKRWFQNLLLSSGFELRQNIVLLQLTLDRFSPFSAPQDFRIRPMRDDDLPAIVHIDLEAFGWFWHNTADALQRARSVAVSATVAENDSGVIGYQISTGNPFGAHLARLTVKPAAQGYGVGGALVNDLIQRIGASRVSVNTQEDNAASLALYRKIGFIRTGECFPVLIYP